VKARSSSRRLRDNSEVTICLVGTKWGAFLGRELRRIYSGRLLVCGRDVERTRRLAKRLDAADYVIGWEEGVTRPDVSAVILAMPAEHHAEAARYAASAGKHVFVEKPIAVTLEDADAMIESARKAGVVLFVGENMPYRPALREARQRLAELGTPRFFQACRLRHLDDRRLSVGILPDMGVHYIRALRYLLGEPEVVFATNSESVVDCPEPHDNASVLLSSRAGWTAVLSFSWQASAGRCPEIIVTGTEGALKIWPESMTLDLYPNRPTRRSRLVSRVRPWWLQEFLQSPERQRVGTRLPRHDRMGYQAELREFLQAVGIGAASVVSAVEGRRDLEIALVAATSASAGAPLRCQPGAVLTAA
jgi:predicted dehydrogenase